jgi:hypothetical protein
MYGLYIRIVDSPCACAAESCDGGKHQDIPFHSHKQFGVAETF